MLRDIKPNKTNCAESVIWGISNRLIFTKNKRMIPEKIILIEVNNSILPLGPIYIKKTVLTTNNNY